MNKVINYAKGIIMLVMFVGSIAGGLYVGGWLMFIQPIIEACKHFDAGTLTAFILGTTVLKCSFSYLVGVIIIYVGVTIANKLCE